MWRHPDAWLLEKKGRCDYYVWAYVQRLLIFLLDTLRLVHALWLSSWLGWPNPERKTIVNTCHGHGKLSLVRVVTETGSRIPNQ